MKIMDIEIAGGQAKRSPAICCISSRTAMLRAGTGAAAVNGYVWRAKEKKNLPGQVKEHKGKDLCIHCKNSSFGGLSLKDISRREL